MPLVLTEARFKGLRAGFSGRKGDGDDFDGFVLRFSRFLVILECFWVSEVH